MTCGDLGNPYNRSNGGPSTGSESSLFALHLPVALGVLVTDMVTSYGVGSLSRSIAVAAAMCIQQKQFGPGAFHFGN